jgi:hypothetical protein
MDEMIEWLRQEYECIFEDGSGKMTVSRGRIHKYLGMTLDYIVKGHVRILMFDYLDEILSAFDNADPQKADRISSKTKHAKLNRNRTCRRR